MPARINSKQKGASFERKICVKLSLWVSKMTDEGIYWRSALSGGRATLRSRKTRGRAVVAQAGDISAVHELGHAFLKLFTIECKFYKDLKLDSMIWGRAAYVEEIWYKTLRLCETNQREPFIVARQNRQDELVWTTQAGLDILRNAVHSGKELRCFVAFPIHGIHIVHLRDLLLCCDPDVLRDIAAPLVEVPDPPRPKRTYRRAALSRRRLSEIEAPPPRERRRLHQMSTAVPGRRRLADV